jgi:transposase
VFITEVPNRNSPPAILLRESYREGKSVRSRTLANLSSLSAMQVAGMKCALAGNALFGEDSGIEKVSDRAEGAVRAVEIAIRRLGLEKLICRDASRERSVVMGMLVARILAPGSKLATTRDWHATTLPEDRGLGDVKEDDLYEAMDWLFERQDAIEKKLAARHLKNDGLVLYDLSSSYMEGTTCPLAKRGYNRDGKSGKLQVNYGLVTDARGCPVAIRVYEGNTSDSTTVLGHATRIKDEFGIDQMVLVGDRGMISQKQVDALREEGNIQWITALKTGAIRRLVETKSLQMGLFDKRNLFSFTDSMFPGERLVACKNEALGKLRAHNRTSLLDATCKELKKVAGMVANGKLVGKDIIGVRVGKVVNKYKMAKHIQLEIDAGSFAFTIDQASVDDEASLDGVYVVRTSVPEERMPPAEAVRSYKRLANVERAFRSMKTVDLHVRPIHHRLENRVRAHILLCMLAYYIQWHMQEALRSMLFFDEDLAAKAARDPVAPAQRSSAAQTKARTQTTADGELVMSLRSLLKNLATITRSTFAPKNAKSATQSFTMITRASPLQTKAFELLALIQL